jgi:hypothetical protein
MMPASSWSTGREASTALKPTTTPTTTPISSKTIYTHYVSKVVTGIDDHITLTTTTTTQTHWWQTPHALAESQVPEAWYVGSYTLPCSVSTRNRCTETNVYDRRLTPIDKEDRSYMVVMIALPAAIFSFVLWWLLYRFCWT